MENSENSNEDALKALESTMALLGEGNTAETQGGVCVWVTSSGARICSAISQANCSLIHGAVFVAGGKCP